MNYSNIVCFFCIILGIFSGISAEENPESRLLKMGITLKTPGTPKANFIRASRTGNLIFLSGHGPQKEDGTFITGKVGADLSVKEGQYASKLTAISLLSSLKAEIGNLNRVTNIVKVFGMVNASPDFTKHSQVINGCSDFLVEVFGANGKHARAAVGMNSLPLGFAVEIEMIVEVDISREYDALETAVNASHRNADFVVRDQYRHPLQTLNFFGIKEDMTVVEVWPGREGWYTEILAPFLRLKGKYIAANFDLETKSEFFQKANKAFAEKLKSSKLYDKVVVTEFSPPNETVNMATEDSADMVLSFRNVHNWMWTDKAEQEAFKAFHRILKPGGILGIVEHRALPESKDLEAKSGYVKESYVIELAKEAGFELLAKSEINANPKDTTIHEKGVWMLLPRLRVDEKDKAKYLQIGESDRMTLKFIKPKK